MEITQRVMGGGGKEWGKKVQGTRSITDRHKIERERFRIV